MKKEITKVKNSHVRREEVKDLYLKGTPAKDIAKAVGAHYETVLKDIDYWNSYYTKLAINNPHIAEKQAERIERLIGEVNLVKQEYWAMLKEMRERVNGQEKKSEEEKKAWETLPEEERKKKPYVAPKINPLYTQRLETLKAIVARIEHEAKLISLFNPANMIQKNFISVEVLKEILIIFKDIINDLIPEDKRGYAFERMKSIDVEAMSGTDIVDAEVLPDEKN